MKRIISHPLVGVFLPVLWLGFSLVSTYIFLSFIIIDLNIFNFTVVSTAILGTLVFHRLGLFKKIELISERITTVVKLASGALIFLVVFWLLSMVSIISGLTLCLALLIFYLVFSTKRPFYKARYGIFFSALGHTAALLSATYASVELNMFYRYEIYAGRLNLILDITKTPHIIYIVFVFILLTSIIYIVDSNLSQWMGLKGSKKNITLLILFIVFVLIVCFGVMLELLPAMFSFVIIALAPIVINFKKFSTGKNSKILFFKPETLTIMLVFFTIILLKILTMFFV